MNNFWNIYYTKYKVKTDRNRRLSVEEYLNKIRPYLRDVINEWKIQLKIANNFIFSLDNDEECVIYSKIDTIETMINDEADEIKEDPFELRKNRYQINLELMRGSEFVFDYVHLMYYKCHEINPNCGGHIFILLIG